jgi:hypothetical protein
MIPAKPTVKHTSVNENKVTFLRTCTANSKMNTMLSGSNQTSSA